MKRENKTCTELTGNLNVTIHDNVSPTMDKARKAQQTAKSGTKDTKLEQEGRKGWEKQAIQGKM